MSVRLFLVISCAAMVMAMEPFQHEWGAVESMMVMHGKYSALDANIPEADIQFIANKYATITTGTSCRMNGTGPEPTIEASVQAVARRVKAVNPGLTSLESTCSFGQVFQWACTGALRRPWRWLNAGSDLPHGLLHLIFLVLQHQSGNHIQNGD